MKNTLRSLLHDRAVMESLNERRDELFRELGEAATDSLGEPTLDTLRPGDLAPQLDVLLAGRELAVSDTKGLTATEAIILLRGRPVLLVQRDTWQAPRSLEIVKWLGSPDDNSNTLRKCLPSVGRIEIISDDDQDYLGTGWMLSEDILITNRHVAEAFGTQRGSGFGFKNWPDGDAMRVRVDFKREYQQADLAQVGVRNVLYIAPAGDIFPDMALVRLERGGGRMPEPIELDEAPLAFNPGDPNDRPPLAVVGYPAEDIRNDAMASRQIFDGIYRVKRLSPGRVMSVTPNGRLLEHDCTTLGGNSGSPIINLATGRVCGLHYAGTYRSRNFAVTAGWLKAQLAELEPRRIFLPPESIEAGRTEVVQPRVRSPEHFDGRDGYRPEFLGEHPDLQVPLPEPDAELLALVAPTDIATDGELKYCHFSTMMRADRRLPLYTAVNIDGGKLFSFPRSRDVWWHDGRLDLDVQASEALYVGNPLDRGHLVRRLDPAWGDTREEAKLGEEDTFHFTNCAPQHEGMNQRTWLSLEDYILGNANILNFKASIFTGPVFGDADKSYRGLQLPQEFWKVAVMVNQATGMLSATGYLLSQADLIKGLEFVYGQYRTYQVPISMIELKTGLRFELGMYDPLDSTEGTPVREVLVPQDMVL
jgi:endonuclease G